jgi:hypothetical protein
MRGKAPAHRDRTARKDRCGMPFARSALIISGLSVVLRRRPAEFCPHLIAGREHIGGQGAFRAGAQILGQVRGAGCAEDHGVNGSMMEEPVERDTHQRTPGQSAGCRQFIDRLKVGAVPRAGLGCPRRAQ